MLYLKICMMKGETGNLLDMMQIMYSHFIETYRVYLKKPKIESERQLKQI